MPYQPFLTAGLDRPGNIICICDHASNIVPQFWGSAGLGLEDSEMNRHIAFDLGAKDLTLQLAKLFNGPAVLSNFSRLVIDPNRGKDDPTLIMKLYDGTIIPENIIISKKEKKRRIKEYYQPYHCTIEKLLERMKTPIIISIHSFTPKLKTGKKRPWEIGILHTKDKRLSGSLLKNLKQNKNLCIGNNLPYSGELPGDSLDKHCITNGYQHVLIELRNDLLSNETIINGWAVYLAKLILKTIKNCK
jgi:predicted N-formylglutamate amidohydrolase